MLKQPATLMSSTRPRSAASADDIGAGSLMTPALGDGDVQDPEVGNSVGHGRCDRRGIGDIRDKRGGVRAKCGRMLADEIRISVNQRDVRAALYEPRGGVRSDSLSPARDQNDLAVQALPCHASMVPRDDG